MDATTIVETINYLKKKNADLTKALAEEKTKTAGLEGTVEEQQQEIQQLRVNMDVFSKGKEALEKLLEERDLEISHLSKKLKTTEAKMAKTEKDSQKTTSNLLSKLKKKDGRIDDITKDLAMANSELEETVVKLDIMKKEKENIQETLIGIQISPTI